MRRWLAAILLVWLALGCASSLPLVGTEWVAEQIDGRPVTPGVRSTLAFQSEKRAVGAAGCNRWFAAVKMPGNNGLSFEHPGTNRMACGAAAMEQESRFLAALAAVRTYRLDGARLWLLDGGGAQRMRLTQTRAPGS